MEMFEKITFLLGAFLVVLFIKFLSVQKRKKRPKSEIPPGPFGFPIFGHLPWLSVDPPKMLIEGHKRFGPIFSVNLGSFPAVVLTGAKIIREALSKSEFCGRPHFSLFQAASNKKGIFFSDGTQNAEQRQFILKCFSEKKVFLNEKIEQEIKAFLIELKEKSKNGKSVKVNHLFNSTVINSLWSLFMDRKFDEAETQYFIQLLTTKIIQADTFLSKVSIFIPWLDVFLGPFGSQKRLKVLKEIYSFMQSEIDNSQKNGKTTESQNICDLYTKKVAETKEINSSFHKNQNFQPFSFGDIFMGGISTTSVTLEWFVLFMIQNLHVQRKLQREIDEVVGNSRSPELKDRPKMPFANAVINELVRFSSTAPIAFYRTTNDVTFHDFEIPKNTIVMANLYATHFDESIWKDPENFRPERWLNCQQSETTEEKSDAARVENLVAFSAGRRVCVGERIGRDLIFLMMTNLLQKFNLKATENPVKVDRIFGVEFTPSEFSVKFEERRKST